MRVPWMVLKPFRLQTHRRGERVEFVDVIRDKVLPVVVYAMMGLMTGMLVYRILLAAVGRGFIESM